MDNHYSTHSCDVCGSEFNRILNKDGGIRKTKYDLCSKQCKARAQVLRNNPNAIKRDWQPKPPCTCLGCGKEYINKRRKKGEGEKYCSRECAFKDKSGSYIVHGHKKAINRTSSLWSGIGAHCRVSFKHCVSCGKSFVARQSGKGVQCSECAASSVGDHKSRARYFKVEYEKIDRIKVFDRDGWKCKICGQPTPREHVGKREASWLPNAPQLDHVIPISKGGPHLYTNVQCLCRLCNLTKKDKLMPVVGGGGDSFGFAAPVPCP